MRLHGRRTPYRSSGRTLEDVGPTGWVETGRDGPCRRPRDGSPFVESSLCNLGEIRP